MPRYLIPGEMTMYRPSSGLLKGGTVIVLPDEDSKPGDRIPLGLIPLDKDAHALLVESAEKHIELEELRLMELEQKMPAAAKQAIRAKVKPVPEDPAAAAEPKKQEADTFTVRQYAEQAGSSMSGAPVKGAPAKGRASDSK